MGIHGPKDMTKGAGPTDPPPSRASHLADALSDQ